jgi:hypothetical protein
MAHGLFMLETTRGTRVAVGGGGLGFREYENERGGSTHRVTRVLALSAF